MVHGAGDHKPDATDMPGSPGDLSDRLPRAGVHRDSPRLPNRSKKTPPSHAWNMAPSSWWGRPCLLRGRRGLPWAHGSGESPASVRLGARVNSTWQGRPTSRGRMTRGRDDAEGQAPPCASSPPAALGLPPLSTFPPSSLRHWVGGAIPRPLLIPGAKWGGASARDASLGGWACSSGQVQAWQRGGAGPGSRAPELQGWLPGPGDRAAASQPQR